MKVRALYLYSYSSLKDAFFTDSHGDSLLLSTTKPLWRFRSRQVAQRATNGTIFIVVLDANHIMDGVGAGEVGVPTVRQSSDHAVCTPETCRLGDELFISGILGVTKGDVVFDLNGDFLGRPHSNRDRETRTH